MSLCTRYNRCSSANIGFLLYRHTLLPLLEHRPLPIGRAPVVIGAMGGSGTRVLVPILQLAGFWMGSWICRRTQDAMATRHLLQCAFPRLLNGRGNDDEHLLTLFSRLIQAHRLGMTDPDADWGWKNPRNMWIIPFLVRCYPEMKFIHLIRDGRDMALTENHNLLRKHGAYLLGEPDCEQNWIRSQFRLWAMGNRLAWEAGQKYLGENYLLLDYDQLCSSPEQELRRIYGHVGIEPDDRLIAIARRLFISSTSTGRWRESKNPMLHRPDEDLREVLTFFGYE